MIGIGGLGGDFRRPTIVGAILILPAQGPILFVAYAMLVVAAFVAVCWLTGEPPRWRWGGR